MFVFGFESLSGCLLHGYRNAPDLSWGFRDFGKFHLLDRDF
jgi:hypothetical protein